MKTKRRARRSQNGNSARIPESSNAPSAQHAARSSLPIMGMSLVALDEAPSALLSEAQLNDLTIQMLAREMNTGRVVAFVGSGVSAAYGYPNWETFVRRVVDATSEGSSSADRVMRWFREKIKTGAPASPDELVLVLDACQEALDNTADSEVFRKTACRALSKAGEADGDPLAALIGLGMRRFVTTNYDDEIRTALRQHASCSDTATRIGRILQFVTAGEGRTASLVQFAVDAPDYRYGVWHCHGHIENGDGLVVTTRDYQRAYFGDGHVETADRQGMELILSSNPILFVGYGMREPDVLRPLREFAATRRRGNPEAPLFALLRDECKDDNERAAIRRQNYARYGVKIIWYRELKLEAAIDGLRDRIQAWWHEWRQKPPVRIANFGHFDPGRKLMIRHKEVDHPPRDSAPVSIAFERPFETEKLYEHLVNKGGLWVVLGSIGTGKGTFAAELVAKWLRERANAKAFLATCRFSNDFLSVVEAATRHFATPSTGAFDTDLEPLERLRAALRSSSDNLLVIGGFERLLDPTRPPEGGISTAENNGSSIFYGVPMTPEIRDTLELFADTNARVVVLSTLCPVLDTAASRAGMRVYPLHPVPRNCVTSAFEKHLSKSCANLTENLYSLLGGHAYALALLLAVAGSEKDRGGDPERWLTSMVTRLSTLEPTHRPERAVAWVIEKQYVEPGNAELRSDVLQCIALATTPVEAHAVATALNRKQEEVDLVLQHLRKLHLVIVIQPPKHDPTAIAPTVEDSSTHTERFTAHTLVRRCVLHAAGSYSLSRAEPQRFTLPCYADEGEELQEVSRGAQSMVSDCVDRLLTKLEGCFSGNNPNGMLGPTHRRQLARAAFGMVRSRWSAIGLSQLAHLEPHSSRAHYEAYQHTLFRLCNIIRMCADPSAVWEHFTVDCPRERDDGILYADELAWLYNELGLVAFIRGSLGDAMSLWLQGLEIHRVTEADKQGRRWRQSMLNLAIVAIERARLADAEKNLEHVLLAARTDRDDKTVARAEGFLGWVYHLRGDDKRASTAYVAALDELQDTNVGRGRSLFLRQLGDLHRRFERFGQAHECLAQSAAVAEHGKHLDLVHWTRLSQAVLALAEGKITAAAGVEDVITFALRMGIPKLEAAALQVRAEAALCSGDLGHAATMARRSLAISARQGMQLKIIGTLVVLGRIAKAQGDLQTAKELLESAARLGRKHSYQLRVEQAERDLRDLPSKAGPRYWTSNRSSPALAE